MDQLPKKENLLDWWRSMGMKSIRDQYLESLPKPFMEPNIEPIIPLQPYQSIFSHRDTISFEPEEPDQVFEPKRRR